MLSRKQRLLNSLGRKVPWLFLLLRRIVRLRARKSYEEQRRDLNYYGEVLRLAKRYEGGGRTVLDVGSAETEVIKQLDGYTQRHTVDIRYIPATAGIHRHTADFLDWQPPCHFNLAMCLQVLEHLTDPAQFARRLFDIADQVIISVPYQWPQGTCAGHVQDPVDEHKLALWTGRQPDETLIVEDGLKRLIAVYVLKTAINAEPR